MRLKEKLVSLQALGDIESGDGANAKSDLERQVLMIPYHAACIFAAWLTHQVRNGSHLKKNLIRKLFDESQTSCPATLVWT